MSNVLGAVCDGLEKGMGWICGKVVDAIKWLLTEGVKAIGVGAITLAKQLSSLDDVFVLIGLVGCMVIIIGKKELGTKLTSGSILGYIICKGVEAYASC